MKYGKRRQNIKKNPVDTKRRRQMLKEDAVDPGLLVVMPELIVDIPVHNRSNPYYPWQFFRIWNHIFLKLLEEHRELNSTFLSRCTLARFLSLNVTEEARVTFCDLKKDFVVVDVQDVINIPVVGEQRCCIHATTTALNDTVDLPLSQKNWEITVYGDLVQVIQKMVEPKDLLVIWGGKESECRRETKGLVLNGEFGPEATILHFQEGLQVVPRLLQQPSTTPAAPILPFINDALDMAFSTSYIGQNACCLQIVPERRYIAPASQNLPGGFFPGSQTSTSRSSSNGTREILGSDVSNNEPERVGETHEDDDDGGSSHGSDFSSPNVSYPGDETDNFSLNDETVITPGGNKDEDPRVNNDEDPRVNNDEDPRVNNDEDPRVNNDEDPGGNNDEDGSLNANLHQERSPARQKQQDQLNSSKRRSKKRKRQALDDNVDWTGVEVIPDSGSDSQPEDNQKNDSVSSQNRLETSSSAKIPRVSLQKNVIPDPVSTSDSDNQFFHEVQHLVSQVLNLSDSQPPQNSNANLSPLPIPIQEGPNYDELAQLDPSEDEELQIQEYMRTQVLSLSPSQCVADLESVQQNLASDVLMEQQGQEHLTSQVLNLSSQCLEDENRENSPTSPPIQNPLPIEMDQRLSRSREGSQDSLSLSQLINEELKGPCQSDYVNPCIKIEQPNSKIKNLCEIEVDDEFNLYCHIVETFRSYLENDNVGYLIVEDGTIPSIRVSYIPRPNCVDLEYSDRFISDISCLIKVHNYSDILKIIEPNIDVLLASVKVERTRDGSLELVMNGSSPGTMRTARGQNYYENAYTQEVPVFRPALVVPNRDETQNNEKSKVEAPISVPTPVSRNNAEPSSLQELEEEPSIVISQRAISTRLRSRTRSNSVQSSHTGSEVLIKTERDDKSKGWEDELKTLYGIKDNEPTVRLERIEMEDM